jgi:hypothetical protein
MTGIVVPFVCEAHRDAVPSERPQLLYEAIIQFPYSLAGEERDDLVPPVDELCAVPPT